MNDVLRPPVLVLCGGKGTRLRPAVSGVPKSLAPIDGAPFLDLLLRSLAARGWRDVVLLTGERAAEIEGYAGDGSAWGIRIRASRESRPMGTAGAIGLACARLALPRTLLVLNGDTFFTGSLDALLETHHARTATATLALVRVEDPARYGAVELGENDRIVAFREKASAAAVSWINAGVYVLGPRLVAALPADGAGSLEHDIFPAFRNQGLYGRRYPDAAFLDIGTPEDYARAASVLADWSDPAARSDRDDPGDREDRKDET